MLVLMWCVFAAGPPVSPSVRWEKQIAAMEKRDRVSPPAAGAVHFCGSSSIVLWDLAEWFPKGGVVKRGFGGSQIADSAYFAGRIITPYRPRAVVLYAGDNDLAAGKSPERVRNDFLAFVAAVRRGSPRTPIHVISIKPSVLRWKLWPTIQRANALIRAECEKGEGLRYIDVATKMLDAAGKPRRDLLAVDGLHLSEEGYRMWTEAVRRSLGE